VASLHSEEEKHKILTERPVSKIRRSRKRSRIEQSIKVDLEVMRCEFVDGVYMWFF
jgi:hypothetical protein